MSVADVAEKEIPGKGVLRSFRLPVEWQQRADTSGTIGMRYLLPFSQSADPDVRICLFYRGLPLSPEGSEAFRNCLQGPREVLFSESEPANQASIQAIESLKETLDNAANNQVLNQESGWFGPHFHLNHLVIIDVAGRSVLSLRGHYRDPATAEPRNYLWTLFFDGMPEEKECPVQEFFLEAPTLEKFENNIGRFVDAMQTIRWRYDAFNRK